MKRIALFGVLVAATATPLAAQQQPATAENQQNEVVTVQRSVGAEAESLKILRSGDKAEINRYVTKVYPLKHANPYEILPYLRGIAALEKGTVATAWNPGPNGERAWIQVNVPDFQIPSIDAAVAAYDVPDFISGTGDIKFSYRTRYRSAVEIASFIGDATLSGDGRIRADADTNTIYVSDAPSDFRRVLAQIQFYDVPTPQLEVEVSVIELTELDQTTLGLDWDFWKVAVAGDLTLSGSTSRTDTNPGITETDITGISGVLTTNAAAWARFLNYLVDQGKAEIYARTNLTIANGTMGTVTSGTEVPSYSYTINTAIGRAFLTRNPTTTIANGEGFSIAMVPEIAMDSAELQVAIALRSPVGVSRTADPIYSEQEVQAQLTLVPGETYKLGGLRRGVEAIERKGIPLLKEIPVVKYLFSVEDRIIRETELHVFLKPRWAAPLLPDIEGIRVDTPQRVPKLQNILKENPTLSISPEDAALLERYFATQEPSVVED